MNGVIQGGWEFVTAAYVLSGVVLLGYTAWVIRCFAVEDARARREAREESS